MKKGELLDVALCTWRRAGIERVSRMELPSIEGVRYLVSWQPDGDDESLPDSLTSRQDVEVLICGGRGVARNRENARMHCRAEIMLIADDDLIYTKEGLLSVIRTFEERPELDVACFRFSGEARIYPERECKLGRHYPKGFIVTAFEMALRKRAYSTTPFDTRFGIGAEVWQAGEEDILLHTLRRKGFECRHIPIVITTHDHPSTGLRRMTEGVAAASGKVISVEYPLSWPLRLPLKAWRHRKESGFWFNLHHLVRGVFSNGKRKDA